MTTAYPLKDNTIKTLRKRSALTSTNVYIVRSVFEDLHSKILQISKAINAYNHYMNSVDRYNQLRKSFSVYRPFKHRN